MTELRWFHDDEHSRCHHWGNPCVRVAFDDGSTLYFTSIGIDVERRQCYGFTISPADPGDEIVVISGPYAELGDPGHLRSGVGEPVDVCKALAAWVSFAQADAETYRSTMDGTSFQAWAYQHDSELSALALNLDDEHDDQADESPVDDIRDTLARVARGAAESVYLLLRVDLPIAAAAQLSYDGATTVRVGQVLADFAPGQVSVTFPDRYWVGETVTLHLHRECSYGVLADLIRSLAETAQAVTP